MKKYLSILLVAIFVVACLPIAALAADAATITGANVNATAGSTASVSFTISEATYATYSMSIVYDSEDLTLTGLTAGEATPANFGFNADNGRFNAAQAEDAKFAGTLVTATFDVPADAKPGDVYPVTLTVRNVTNAATEALDITVIAGSITIVHEHSWGEWYVLKVADCVNDGIEARDCACGEQQTRVVSALGHLPGDAVQENYKAPTQTEDGGYDLVVYCQRCGAELSRNHHVIPALGYDDEPNTGDFSAVLGMVAIMTTMVPCLVVDKFRAVK